MVVSVEAGKEDRDLTSQHGARFPGGVADIAREVAFIGNGGGIDSIDLRSGHRRWRSTSAIAPLTLLDNGSELVAAGFDDGKMFIVTIENDSGDMRKRWDLSPGVFVSAQTCEIATEFRESKLDIIWNVHSRYKGGANLSPGAEQRFHIDASGMVEINLGSRAIEKQERTNLEDLSSKHQWPNDLIELTVNDRIYSIRPGRGQETGLSLVARDRGVDRVLWEYPLVGVAKASPRQRP